MDAPVLPEPENRFVKPIERFMELHHEVSGVRVLVALNDRGDSNEVADAALRLLCTITNQPIDVRVLVVRSPRRS